MRAAAMSGLSPWFHATIAALPHARKIAKAASTK